MPNYTTPYYFSKSADGTAGSINFTVYASSISFLTTQSTDETDSTRVANSPIVPQDSTHWAWTYPKGVVWIKPSAYASYTVSNLGVWMETISAGTMVLIRTNAYGIAPINMDSAPALTSNSSNSYNGMNMTAIYPSYSNSSNIFIVDTRIPSGITTTHSSDYLIMSLRVDSSASPGNWTGTLYYTYTVQ